MTAPRLARRLLSTSSKSEYKLPAHLQTPFHMAFPPGRCMILGKPWWRYPLAVVPPEPQVAPLITAIRQLEEERRPFRIISHEDEAGRVFNASFFDDESKMNGYAAAACCAHTHTLRRR